MLNLKIETGDVKSFMGALLTGDTFDFLEVRGVDIATFTHFNISGQKILPKPAEVKAGNDDTDIPDDKPEKIKAIYCKWAEIRPFVHNIIKGGARPGYMKIIFSMEPAEALKLHENSAAMYLNITYNGEEVFFTSATAQRGFRLDKSLDHVWEDYLIDFFRVNEINVKEIEME